MNNENFSLDNLVSTAPKKEYPKESSDAKETTSLELTDYEKKVVKRLIHHIGVWIAVVEGLLSLTAFAAVIFIGYILISWIF